MSAKRETESEREPESGAIVHWKAGAAQVIDRTRPKGQPEGGVIGQSCRIADDVITENSLMMITA